MYEQKEEAMAEFFSDIDTDNDGYIDSIEFRDLVMEFYEGELSAEEVGEAFDKIDADGDGKIQYGELASWWED